MRPHKEVIDRRIKTRDMKISVMRKEIRELNIEIKEKDNTIKQLREHIRIEKETK